MDPDQDAVLLAAFRTGDTEALATLVRRYQGALQRAALQVVREPSDAQDVVQETFLRVYRGRESFRGQGSVRAWLYRITINLAIDLVRRRRRQVGEPVDPAAEEAAGGDALDEVLRRERKAAVRAAVEALPAHYRLPLILREWHDLSYAEISAVLRVPVGTVRSRLHDGREALRRQIETTWAGEEEQRP